jgi:hypothetical protein
MHPVRCVIARPRVGYTPLGSEDLQNVLTKQSKELQQSILDAVIKQAALATSAQLGVVIFFWSIPALGQALAGLLSLMNMILGQVYQRDIQQVIAEAMEAIKARGEASQARVEAAQDQVCVDEYPTVIRQLISGQPLGSLWTDITNPITTVLKRSVVAPVKQVIVDPQKQMKFLTTLNPVGLSRLAVKSTMKVATFGAKRLEVAQVVKPGQLTTPLNAAQSTVDDAMFSAQRMTSPLTMAQESVGLTFHYGTMVVAEAMEATGNENGAEAVRKIGEQVHGSAQAMMTALTPTGGYNLFSGREGYLAARAACAEMRNKAFAAIDANTKEAITKIQSIEGRHTARIALGKALQNDPDFQAMLKELLDLRAQQTQVLSAGVSLLEQAAGPPSSSGAGTFLGVAAAGVAAFMIAR